MNSRSRKHGESVDEFAEAITHLAQKAHPTHKVGTLEDDPITACITDRFCMGQSDSELSRHLSLYPSRILGDLIGACDWWEASASPKSHQQSDRVYAMKAHKTRKTSWFHSDMEEYARSKGLQLCADAPVSSPVPRGGKRSSPNPPRRSNVDKKKV